MIAIGIDIGGTNTKIGLVNDKGELSGFRTFPTTQPKNFVDYTQKIHSTVMEMVEESSLDCDQIAGIGLGAPNGNGKNGHIENPPNLKQWGTVDLLTPLKSLFHCPIYLENDANVAAIGEGVWGRARGCHDYLVVTLGTGVGTGIVVNNQLVRGSNGLAGEGGHITIEKDGRLCGCGGHGHLEQYASVQGIKKTAKEMLGDDLKFKEIFERYQAKDEKILEVIHATAEYLGFGLSLMGSLMGPEKIVLAGGVAMLGESFCEMVSAVYERYVYEPFRGITKVEVSNISTSEGAVLGAASLVLKNL